MSTVLQEHDVPPSMASVPTLDRIDYVDVFTLKTASATDRSAVDWARAVIEDAAGLKGQFVWRGILGLRLDRRDPDNIAGWKITGREDDRLLVEASSWLMTAQLVAHVDEGQVSVGTFICYRNPIAAVLWPALSVVHRRALPGLLRHAERSLGTSG